MISQTAEYALRALVHLAAVRDEPSPQTIGQIAAGTRVSPGYMAKVLQSLTHAGLVLSQRGVAGGFRLSKAPGETSVYEVIQAVDPIERIRTCPLGLDAHGTDLCPLHRRLDDALALIEEQFRATTLEDLAGRPDSFGASDSGGATCVFPNPPQEPAGDRDEA